MIVDSSALVAVIKAEDDAASIIEVLRNADRPGVGAPTLVETRLVLSPMGALGEATLDRVLDAYEIHVIGFDERHAARAHEAHRRYGRGSGHRARLNYGDCMAYAVASVERRPLLFKGDDFVHTDIESAL